MQLVIAGSSGARTCSWESYAVLRAQLRHKVEADQTSGRFRALDSVARAAHSGAQAIDAVRLRLEVLQAGAALGDQDAAAVAPALQRPAPGEFSEVVLFLTARAVAGDRLLIRVGTGPSNR
jgi:hypothetical protein